MQELIQIIQAQIVQEVTLEKKVLEAEIMLETILKTKIMQNNFSLS